MQIKLSTHYTPTNFHLSFVNKSSRALTPQLSPSLLQTLSLSQQKVQLPPLFQSFHQISLSILCFVMFQHSPQLDLDWDMYKIFLFNLQIISPFLQMQNVVFEEPTGSPFSILIMSTYLAKKDWQMLSQWLSTVNPSRCPQIAPITASNVLVLKDDLSGFFFIQALGAFFYSLPCIFFIKEHNVLFVFLVIVVHHPRVHCKLLEPLLKRNSSGKQKHRCATAQSQSTPTRNPS